MQWFDRLTMGGSAGSPQEPKRKILKWDKNWVELFLCQKWNLG